MPQVAASTVIDASAGDVWQVIRDFGRLDAWYEGMPRPVLETGTAAEVGCVRRIEVGGQLVAREQLVALDDRHRSQTYRILESVFGLREYVSTLRVLPVTDRDRSFVEWSARFEADEPVAGDLTRMVRDEIYAPGLISLRERLERT
jgi:hypothetical protein